MRTRSLTRSENLKKANYVNAFDEIFQESIDALRERVWDLNTMNQFFIMIT